MSRQVAYKGGKNDPPLTEEWQLEEKLEALANAPSLAIDTETISLTDRTCIGVGVSWNANEGLYFGVIPERSPDLELLGRILADRQKLKIFHNATYDLDVLGHLAELLGWPEIDTYNIGDTLLLAKNQLLPNALADLAEVLLGWRIYTFEEVIAAHSKERKKQKKSLVDLEWSIAANKCLDDCKATFLIYDKLYKYIDHNYIVDIKLIPILIKMGSEGIAIDRKALWDHHDRLTGTIVALEAACKIKGFNPASPRQVGQWLGKNGSFLPFTRKGKQLQTDDKTLAKLKEPYAHAVLQYRKASKLESTYVWPLTSRPRATTHFRLDLATTRLASSNMNMQNWPEEMRDILDPDSGMFTWIDWSQLEMRIFAFLSQDPVMLAAFNAGKDIHAITQEALWPGSDPKNKSMRTRAKIFNFAMIFYATAALLAVETGLPLAACTKYREAWLNLYRVGHLWMIAQAERAHHYDYAETLFGVMMALPNDRGILHKEKCSINYPVQGSAAGLVKRGMHICDNRGFKMLLQVHDELLFDGIVDPPEYELSHIIQGLYTPFGREVGPKWLAPK